MAMHSNIASIVGRIADNSSDSDESDNETDSSGGLEVIEEISTGKAQDLCEETLNTNSNVTVRSLLTVLKAPKRSGKEKLL